MTCFNPCPPTPCPQTCYPSSSTRTTYSSPFSGTETTIERNSCGERTTRCSNNFFGGRTCTVTDRPYASPYYSPFPQNSYCRPSYMDHFGSYGYVPPARPMRYTYQTGSEALGAVATVITAFVGIALLCAIMGSNERSYYIDY